MTRAHLYCESYKTMNTTNIKECYGVGKKKLIRSEKTKPQTAYGNDFVVLRFGHEY